MNSSQAPGRFPSNNLRDYLEMFNVDVLRRMMGQLFISKPRPTRKAEMIAAIASRLTNDDFLRGLWNILGKVEQLVVRDALYDPDGQLGGQRFHARYGVSPPEPSKYGHHPSPVEFFSVRQSPLCEPAPVPDDLAERLLTFVPPPPKVELAVEEKLPEFVEWSESRYTSKGKEIFYDNCTKSR
ncbi:MAG: hypothetical protein OXG56_11370 [Gammaproteobacteria bacterium]|nr:hypothetical protein [Gammaproteobacteria bacterium]